MEPVVIIGLGSLIGLIALAIGINEIAHKALSNQKDIEKLERAMTIVSKEVLILKANNARRQAQNQEKK